MTVITVFGRHGCHLCEVAVEVLEGMQLELNFFRVDPERFKSSLEKHRQRQ